MNYDDLDVDVSNVVDLINIKSFPELISNFLRENSKKKYNNLRKFYSSMLDFFGEDIKISYLNRILKYLSSEKSSKIYLIDDINDGLYDNELLNFSNDLVKVINSANDYYKLYDSIDSKINFIFYESEYYEIKKLYEKKNYVYFIYYLLKHAFKNYKISLPGIVGKRLYMSIKTVRSNLPRYIRTLNAGSLLGNDDCTMQLYSILSSKDFNCAINILLRSKENEMVLWAMAYNLEKNNLKKEIIQQIKYKYKYIFEYHDDFIDSISVTNFGRHKYNIDTILYAYKIYNYCYKKYDFTKAGNSLGKLLLYGVVEYCESKDKSLEMAKKFLEKEMCRGNVDAITNIAIYYYNNLEDNKYSIEQIKRLLKSPASFGEVSANYYLGKILFDEGEYQKSFKYLEFASDQNYKHANLLLGKYYELFDNLKEAKKSYKKGIVNGNFDCAYYLALLYIQDEKKLQVKGYELLNRYNNLFSKPIKNLVNEILKQKNS